MSFTQSINIKIYGDSIMRGVLYDAATNKYSERIGTDFKRLIERGVAISCDARMGATSTKGLALMQRDIANSPDAHYDLTLIEYGANDADYDWDAVSAAPNKAHETRTSEETFISNMKQMISMARPRTDIVALATLPPFETEKFFWWLSRRLNSDNIISWLGEKENVQKTFLRYNELVKQIAKEESCELFDMRSVLLSNGDMTCDDGAHPSQAGYDLLDKSIVNFAKTLISHS